MSGLTRTVQKYVYKAVVPLIPARNSLFRADSDIRATATRLSREDTARYYLEHMAKARSFRSRFELLQYAVAQSAADGLFLEFGVATGKTINHIARFTPATVFGFDSFAGLPEDWHTRARKGRYAQAPPAVDGNVELIIGLFDETLPGFLVRHPEPVSFLHVDADLYSSAVTIFTSLWPRLRPGTVIVFDEYFNYPGWREHEFKAFREFVSAHDARYQYLGFVGRGAQVCVKVLQPVGGDR